MAKIKRTNISYTEKKLHKKKKKNSWSTVHLFHSVHVCLLLCVTLFPGHSRILSCSCVCVCVCVCGWFLLPWSLSLDHAGLHACNHVCVCTVNKATSQNPVCSPSFSYYGEKWWTLTLTFPLPSCRPSPSHPSRWGWKDLGSTNTQHTMHLLYNSQLFHPFS